jgi:hypothetical protein
MSIVVRIKPSGMTAEQYDGVSNQLKESGDWPADGCDYHVCFGSEGNLVVSEIWDSREQLEAFGEKLRPVLQEKGIQITGDPEIFEVHNIERR